MIARVALAAALVLCVSPPLWADSPGPVAAPVPAAGAAKSLIGGPPAELGLDPFYRKHLDAGGFPIVGSERVSDYALLEARYIVDSMLENRPDIRRALVANKVRLAVMACTELTTDIPEHSDLTPKEYWDRRARGLGATHVRPAVSCGEENLLGFPGDPYAAENILVHEFAHAIHQMGLNSIDRSFDRRLRQLYDRAIAAGLWEGTYAARNRFEYWAEGVQSWFDTNRPPDREHNDVNTREKLQEYDPDLAALIAEVFGNTPWRYRRPADRDDPAHLDGYDPRTAPRFRWPRHLRTLRERQNIEAGR